MIDFVNTEFLDCVVVGVVAGGAVSLIVAGVRAVVRFVLRTIRKA